MDGGDMRDGRPEYRGPGGSEREIARGDIIVSARRDLGHTWRDTRDSAQYGEECIPAATSPRGLRIWGL